MKQEIRTLRLPAESSDFSCLVVATGLEENKGVFLLINGVQKRRFFKGFLTITNNEKQPRTTPVGVRVGVSVGVRKTSCIVPLSVGLSNKFNLKEEVITMTNLEKEIIENGIHYTLHGDYYFPDLELPGVPPQAIGHYGRMRLNYLQEHRPGLYTRLILSGTLYEHLAEIDQTSRWQMEQIISQMALTEGVDEILKAKDQMVWVGRMNNIRQCAEEIILAELIYE